MRVHVIRFVHFTFVLFSTLYLFIFNPSFDIIYIAYTVLMYIHWPFLRNECILTYLENRYYDENYVLGEDARSNLYMRTILGDSTDTFMVACGVASVVSFCIVLLRLHDISDKTKVTYLSIFLLYAALMSAWKMEEQQDGFFTASISLLIL